VIKRVGKHISKSEEQARERVARTWKALMRETFVSSRAPNTMEIGLLRERYDVAKARLEQLK